MHGKKKIYINIIKYDVWFLAKYYYYYYFKQNLPSATYYAVGIQGLLFTSTYYIYKVISFRKKLPQNGVWPNLIVVIYL